MAINVEAISVGPEWIPANSAQAHNSAVIRFAQGPGAGSTALFAMLANHRQEWPFRYLASDQAQRRATHHAWIITRKKCGGSRPMRPIKWCDFGPPRRE